MKKINKKNILKFGILTISFFLFIILLCNGKYYYGSSVDWLAQHATIPEYFRALFYKTKDVFPDFAFHLGSGQNIYNFSYYGFLSPIILFSYLFPFIKMIDYIVISTIVMTLVSSFLLYMWLQKKGYQESICFTCAFLFLFSSPLSFHSHRHIMFINYMPFLLLGLFGVDKKLEKNKSVCLALSVFLMIMTSYYYSIGGILCLVIYGVYTYIKMHKTITWKAFLIDGITFIAPIFLGILMSAILILPTFQVILSGRGETFTTIHLTDLFLPIVHIRTILYDPYGVGLTAIALLSVLCLFDGKRENIFLGVILALTVLFPVMSYLLNATMYIDAKALIPLLPLFILAIASFLKKIFAKELPLKIYIPIFIVLSFLAYFEKFKFVWYLLDVGVLLLLLLIYFKWQKKYLLILPICVISFAISFGISKADELVEKESYDMTVKNVSDAILSITQKDESYYRINNGFGSMMNNKIYNNLDYYDTSLYSSTYNLGYNKFYFDTMNNNIASRNRVITSPTNNPLFSIFSSEKYKISKTEKQLQGFELVDKKENVFIYKNEHVLPLGYASSKLLSENDFETLAYPYQAEALVNTIVVDAKTNYHFIPNIKEIKFNKDNLTGYEEVLEKENTIVTSKKTKMTYHLEKEYQNHIIFIRLQIKDAQSCELGDISIDINGNRNKLTCAEWKYHNQNYLFDYVIADKDVKDLNITFTEGTFTITNIELYALDYAYLESLASKVDPLVIESMENDTLKGTIDAKEDGYFTISIPYDNGFEAWIDGEKVEVEKVNTAFIGFPIKKGNHVIKITYSSPLKNVGMVLSILGFIFLAIVCFLESKQKI